MYNNKLTHSFSILGSLMLILRLSFYSSDNALFCVILYEYAFFAFFSNTKKKHHG